MHRMRLLNESERVELEAKLKKTKDLSEWKRIFAIIGYDDGRSIEKLSKLLRISTFTVESYLKEYDSKNKTKNDPRGGSQSKLTPAETQELEQHLVKKTYLKVKDIVVYVLSRFGKKYSRSGMTAWLEDHGFAFKRPKKVPGKLDPEAQARFIEEYRKLKDSLGDNEEIYFMDAVHPEYQSHAACGWIKKGECKTLQTTGRQVRLHFAGALCLKGMNLVVNEYDTIDGPAVIDFFRQLEKKSTATTIHVILDNARAQKNKLLKKFLENSRIKLHYLPPYSPNLNPIERLWKICKETTGYNHYYPCSKDFFNAVRGFFTEKIPRMIEVLKSRITDNFQVIKLNPVNST